MKYRNAARPSVQACRLLKLLKWSVGSGTSHRRDWRSADNKKAMPLLYMSHPRTNVGCVKRHRRYRKRNFPGQGGHTARQDAEVSEGEEVVFKEGKCREVS